MYHYTRSVNDKVTVKPQLLISTFISLVQRSSSQTDDTATKFRPYSSPRRQKLLD